MKKMPLNKLIKNMEINPLRYIGEYDIEKLSIFITAFLYGKDVSQTMTTREKIFREKFSFWVRDYYNAPEISVGWADILYFYEGLHKPAIETFFELYKQWYQEEFGEDAW